MDVKSKAYQELLKKRPLNVQARFGETESAGVISRRRPGKSIPSCLRQMRVIRS